MNGDRIHYEVLLRLKDSQDNFIAPDAFLPTAERFDIITDIDKWVIDNALKILSEETKNNSSLSINLSAQSLNDEEIITYIKEKLETYKITPSNVTFEITETGAVTNIDSAKVLISELKTLGCKFALDDFGTGFCSFGHLKHLEVDVIKIDGLFTKGLITDPIDKGVILAINEIAHSLGKHTVIEYVDSMELMKELQTSGVDYIQGFYISEPLTKLS